MKHGVTMILPGETEAGSAGMQPCRGIAWWAHRDDDRRRGNQLLALRSPIIGSKDPDALKIPARRAEFTLTENASSPFHAEPGQLKRRLEIVPGVKVLFTRHFRTLIPYRRQCIGGHVQEVQ